MVLSIYLLQLISLSGLLYYKTDILKWHNKYLLLVISFFFYLNFFLIVTIIIFLLKTNKDTIKSIYILDIFYYC